MDYFESVASTIVLCVIFFAPLLVFLPLLIAFSIRKNKYVKFIKKNSTLIPVLNEINKEYQFYEVQNSYKIYKLYSIKREWYKTTPLSYFRQCVGNNKKTWSSIYSKITHNRDTLVLYNHQVEQMHNTIDFEKCVDSGMDFRKCINIEIELLNGLLKKPTLDTAVNVRLRYVSPKGRVDTSKTGVFSYSNLAKVLSLDCAYREQRLTFLAPSGIMATLNKKEQKYILEIYKMLNSSYPNQLEFRFIKNKYCCFQEESGEQLFSLIKNKKTLSLVFADENKDKNIQKVSADQKTLSATYELIDGALKSVFEKQKQQLIKESDEEKDLFVENLKYCNIHSYIRDELLNKDYKATPSEKALCRSVKKYLFNTYKSLYKTTIETLDSNSSFLFYGSQLSWGELDALRSAKIVYCFFKANTVIERIKTYEETSDLEIITNEKGLIRKLFSLLIKDVDIDFKQLPYLSQNFEIVPENVLNEILENFKSYES